MRSIKTKNRFYKRRWFIITLVITLLLMAAGGAYFYQKLQQQNKKDEATSKTTNSSKNDRSTTTTPGLPSESSTKTSDEVPVDKTLTVNIGSVSQQNGIVSASATTSGTGTCVFLFSTENDRPVTRQVVVDSNKCQVNISQNEFSYIGQWNLKVTYYNNGNKVDANKNITIN